ncbi:RHS repeat domain-containing protein [Polluticaenibacter yanchengensis]|uniref:RHS repeat-associated core domain-containing protein n=1 Tax=Polluticaenibacter yanchengensis TaxID=3014562 RepID=A0ABT4UL07_9BACT|nr:hypothetical protein [Chitinophagaceae bacterium LY-5]
MQKYSYLLLTVILTSLFLFSSGVVSAAKEKFLAEARINGLPSDSIIRVADTGYARHASEIERNHLRRNIIGLSIDEYATRHISGNFRSVVYVSYRLKNYSDHQSDEITDSLVVTYDTLNGYHLRDYRVFNDIQESQVQVRGYATDNSAIDVRSILKLTNEIELDRSYKWNGESCSVTINGLTNAAMPGQDLVTNTFDELPVSWLPLTGSDEYDLEWTWVDKGPAGYGTLAASVFRNNASRVSISGVSYNIPLLFDGEGKLCYRVRPVKLLPDGSRKTGLWSHEVSGGVINTFEYKGFQRKLNWQATTSFAEEGKRKSVVNYFDGSLRSRQTVTRDNSTTVNDSGRIKNNAVIAETFYDYQGRAAVQVLPAPSVSTLLTYVNGFNKNINSQAYDKADFDKLGEGEKCCGKAAGKMNPATSGAAHYYSPQSVFLTQDATKSYSRFVPDADSVPFIQTEYSLDNTGRIARQGGVGKDYQLGKHDTRYYYGKPSQRELDILFGTEAGKASHYFKNMVRDANGQYSISYMDMQGRTIATALAGNLPDSIKLEGLADAVQFRATDTITSYTEGLSIIATEGMVVPLAGTYVINYRLNPERLVLENCAKDSICYDCLYDLDIAMIEDCGDTLFYHQFTNISLDSTISSKTIDSTCNGKPFNFSKTIQVPEGSYTLVKKLTINKASLDAYRDSIFLVQNTCRDYESFLKEEIDSLKAQLPCVVSCTDCFAALGAKDAFVKKYVDSLKTEGSDTTRMAMEAAVLYKEAYSSCAALCPSDSSHITVLDMIEAEMLQDVTPPYGIYANPTRSNSPVFLETAPGKWLYQDASFIYKDGQGLRDQVVNSSGVTVYPNALDQEAFIENFRPSWANSLLELHPEYCKLSLAKQWEASYKYDELVRNTDRYEDALSKGLLNAPSASLDPAMNSTLAGGSNAFKEDFRRGLLEYRIKLIPSVYAKTSIWHLATKSISCMDLPEGAHCISNDDLNRRDTALNVSGWCAGDKDMAWRTFKSFYLAVKEKILYEKLHSLCGGSEFGIDNNNRRFVPPAATDGLNTMANAQTNLDNGLDTTIANACEGYASLWMSNLEHCRYTNAQWNSLNNYLVAICKDGGDMNHFSGASSVRPGKTNAYANNFIDAVKRFNAANGISTNTTCNGYLIVQPPPYESSNEALVNTPIAKRPSDTSCLCKNLNYYFTEKQNSGNDSLSLGAYLRTFYGAEIEDSTADILRAVCNEPASGCRFLPAQYTVGPVLMNCEPAKPSCLECDEVKSYDLLFKTAFGNIVPSYANTDSTQQSINLLYQRFMNYHTGFGEDYTVYLDFLASCALRDTASGCIFTDSIYNNFKAGYYRSRQYNRDNGSGCDTGYWNSNYGGGYQQDVPLNAIMENGLFKAKRTGDQYSSIDYNDTLDFAPFTFETRVRMPRTGHRYNPYNSAQPYTFLVQFNVVKADGTAGRAQFAFDISPDLPTSLYYLYDSVSYSPHTYNQHFDDWRLLKIVAGTGTYSVYIDNVLVKEYAHRYYRKFCGFMIESFGESFRMDWIKIKNQCNVEVMNESFSSCTDMGYIKKALTDSCTDCRTAFTNYFNTANGRSYNYSFTQLDSLYRHNCNRVLDVCGPPAVSGDSCAIIRYYMDLYTQEMSRTDTLYPVNIVTTLGNLTPTDGPKGVFDVKGQLLGNTVSGTPLQIKQSFAGIWNNSAENRKVGQLLIGGNDQLYLKLKKGAIYPCNGIVGMRYYQADIQSDTIASIHTGIGSYIGWGDGTGDHVMGAFSHTKTTCTLRNDFVTTASNFISENYSPLRYQLTHYFGVTGNKTLTVYHPDTLGVVGNDVTTTPNYIYRIKHLRGYFPKETLMWMSHASMDTSYNTYNKIVNFDEVMNLRYFLYAPGWASALSVYQNGYVNKFGSLAGKSKLEYLFLDTHTGALVPISHKSPIHQILPDWNVNFPNVAFIVIRGTMGVDYNRDSLRYRFPKLRRLELNLSDIDSKLLDTVIHEIAVTSQVCGGYFKALTYSSGTTVTPTDMGSADLNYLRSKGWVFVFQKSDGSGVIQLNATGSCTTPAASDVQPLVQRSGFPMRSSLSEYLNARTGFVMSAARLTQKLAGCGIASPCERVLIRPLSFNKLCGRSGAIFPGVRPVDVPPCADTLLLAGTKATLRYRAYLDSLKNTFDSLYVQRCLRVAGSEVLTVEKPNFEYHYTLYYYDQGGNLVRTVPPEGVNLYRKSLLSVYGKADIGSALNALAWDIAGRRGSGRLKSLRYTLATFYRYNSLNQVTEQKTPDGGISRFWYDELGRLVVSQNAKQALESKYSYTLYDVLGRITEVGETGERPAMTESISRNPAQLLAWLNTNISTQPLKQITQTVYDVAADLGGTGMDANRFKQDHLRNRVSFTKVIDSRNTALSSITAVNNNSNYRQASIYDYDIHGNVKNLLHDYKEGAMAAAGLSGLNRFKQVRYDYDLVSGKVNMVSYQPGYYDGATLIRFKDQFYHRYEYDAENKLTAVYTSIDSVYWEKDAAYKYYRHGPLARTEMGQAKVQGLDYAYTLQGWLKGLNSTFNPDVTNRDMGEDGKAAPSGGGNNVFARDAVGFALHYNAYDYKGTGVAPLAFHRIDVDHFNIVNLNRPLYNGNIMASTVIYQGDIGTGLPSSNVAYGPGHALSRIYSYDKLNRLVVSSTLPEVNSNGTIKWNFMAGTTENFGYDANGNITKLLRYGFLSNHTEGVMDSLSYYYTVGTNRLRYVRDSVLPGRFSEDIDNQVADNYAYDAIGNLVRDDAENIRRIVWTVYGKIDSIYKVDGTLISYGYDGGGNRVSKRVKVGDNTTDTWYVRDAQGNVLNVYTYNVTDGLSLSETHLYGSSRLGIMNRNVHVSDGTGADDIGYTINDVILIGKKYNFERGYKVFEIGNHLGNVLLAVSDRKRGVRNPSNVGEVLYYRADVRSASDYYAFGAPVKGRSYQGGGYRYGFNGKEKDNEISGEGNKLDFGARIYDSRLGRWLSVDRIVKHYESPYMAFANNPVWIIDSDGMDSTRYYSTKGVYLMTVTNGKRGYNRAMIVRDNRLKAVEDYANKYSKKLQGAVSNNVEIDNALSSNGDLYDLNSFIKFYNDNINKYHILSIKGKRVEDMTSITINGRKVSKDFVQNLKGAEVTAYVKKYNGIFAVDVKSTDSDNDLMESTMPYISSLDKATVTHIHLHPSLGVDIEGSGLGFYRYFPGKNSLDGSISGDVEWNKDKMRTRDMPRTIIVSQNLIRMLTGDISETIYIHR